MRVKILALGAVLMMSAAQAAPAQAGSCLHSAHCVANESGVYVFRGQHAPAVSQQALALRAQQQRQAQAAQELAAVNRLNAAIAQQTAEISALKTQVANSQRAQYQRPRRRTYYGNSAFFGRNGFVGNRYFSGATVPLPRRPRRPRQRPVK